jgi:hypothetical protein
MVSRFVRKVRAASGAVAVQVVTRRGRRVEGIEHVGSAHTDAELALLLAAARERLAAGQEVLDLGEIAEVSPPVGCPAEYAAMRRQSHFAAMLRTPGHLVGSGGSTCRQLVTDGNCPAPKTVRSQRPPGGFPSPPGRRRTPPTCNYFHGPNGIRHHPADRGCALPS